MIYLFDTTTTSESGLVEVQQRFEDMGKKYLLVGNKADLLTSPPAPLPSGEGDSPQKKGQVLYISAAQNHGIDELKKQLVQLIAHNRQLQSDTVVTNLRHYEHLVKTYESLQTVLQGIDNRVTSDWLAFDLREALRHLGAITGKVDIDQDILGTIFGKFCIGK